MISIHTLAQQQPVSSPDIIWCQEQNRPNDHIADITSNKCSDRSKFGFFVPILAFFAHAHKITKHYVKFHNATSAIRQIVAAVVDSILLRVIDTLTLHIDVARFVLNTCAQIPSPNVCL